jgi:hypothetical protein
VPPVSGIATANAAERQARQERERDRRPPQQRQPSIFLEPGVFDQIGATPQQRQDIQRILAKRDSGSALIFREMRPIVVIRKRAGPTRTLPKSRNQPSNRMSKMRLISKGAAALFMTFLASQKLSALVGREL